MITGMRLDNFRGFVTTGDLEFSRINLFYGPNSGGKSTILRALSLLKQSFDHNAVDFSCPLLPYSRDGVDMGSAASIHHNLDTSVPFRISLCCQRVRPMAVQRSSVDSIDPRKAPTDVFFQDNPDAALRLTIGSDAGTPTLALQEVAFGNKHLSICLKPVSEAPQLGSLFEASLLNLLDHVAPQDELEVLAADAEGHAAPRRRRLRASLRRRLRPHMGDEFDPSGCFAVSSLTLSEEYGTAVAAYLRACCRDISTFAGAMVRDCTKLGLPDRTVNAKERGSLDHHLRLSLQNYFEGVEAFFSKNPGAESCLAWWKEDLERSRILLFGYVACEYEAAVSPPLAYWLSHDAWTEWRRLHLQSETPAPGDNKRPFYNPAEFGVRDCDDVTSLFSATFETITSSLAAIRDIGPDRAGAERVYREEPRKTVRESHVGRRADGIPRLLHESPRLLADLNKWLQRVRIPYQLSVEPLEIHRAGEVRQTGLFELTATLSHTRNAHINLCDVGHGLFKQLGLPIQVFLGAESIITIEEPETNVHPRLQAEIADLFIEAVQKWRHQIFAEAHSELLALRLQRRIAEGSISHDDVRLFYVHTPDSGPCEVLPLQLDRHGNLLNEPPGGFMDEWLREV